MGHVNAEMAKASLFKASQRVTTVASTCCPLCSTCFAKPVGFAAPRSQAGQETICAMCGPPLMLEKARGGSMPAIEPHGKLSLHD